MRILSSIVILLTLSLATVAQAAEPNVTAVLTDSGTVVGRPVQLEIQITGASNPKPPGEIQVDGLDIRSAGTSRQYQMNNFSVSYSFTFTYTIMPLKVGAFKIPPQRVEVGGKTFQTPELTLNVAASSGQSSRSGRSNRNTDNPDVDPAQIGFLEMLLPKSVAYVGEVVPVQVRLGLNMRAPIESLNQGVQIAGQGFTTQKMTEPRQTIETINGQTYQMFIFNTAISPARAGTLEIGPAEINPVVRVPRPALQNRGFPRSRFDDPFDTFNQLLNDPAFAPSVAREVKLASKATTLEVKPLPPKAPPGFSGAVGMFSIKADARPNKARVGDPVTVTTSLTGRGNFDRVTAPTLEDETGWHLYPPSDSFKQDDDVGISGVKTFEMVVSAKERKDKLPPLVFSYFDPVKEMYVTLRSDAIPLQITGDAAPAPAPVAAASPPANAPPSATPAPTSVPRAQDILTQLDDRAVGRQSFTPLYAQRLFWAAQALPFVALLGFVGWQLRRAHLADRAAQRVARLQSEASDLQRKLRLNGGTPQQYVADASRVVQLKAALASNVEPNAVDAETAAAAFRLDEVKRAHLQQLFAQSDELRYSGGGNGERALSPERKQEILDLVEGLRA